MTPAFWRTLDERAHDPAFQERLTREFPSQIDAIIDPAKTRDTLITALEAAALNPVVPAFNPGILQT